MRPTKYRTYTDEDIAYMWEHRHDKPSEVAKALNAHPRTVGAYLRRMRDGTFARGTYPPRKYYAVYLKKTDEIICSGTAAECAEALGIGVRAFYVRACKALTGRTTKWEVYVEPFQED